ncbi:MAG: hypothetical protein KDA29_10630 [Phycisphaerales bacterium]|nr:hypothetical protein [Phycisphaerales bacterium]
MRTPPTRFYLSAATFALIAALGGCESPPALRETTAWHGQTPIAASYRFGTLKTELPPGTSIETVMAASKAVLYRQGHTIEEATVTPSDGSIVALGGANSPYDKIKIRTKYQGGGVQLEINIDPTTESRSRVVLESILQTLGI